MTLYGIGKEAQRFKFKHQEKGHYEELIAFEEAIRRGELPIALDEMIQATRLSFIVDGMVC